MQGYEGHADQLGSFGRAVGFWHRHLGRPWISPAQRPPDSYARNNDLSVHDLNRAPDQVTCPNAIQAIVKIA